MELFTNVRYNKAVKEISLKDNEINDPSDIELLKNFPNLKALWLNDNPVVKNCENFSTKGNSFPALEVFNGELTSRAGEWAMCYLARGTG